MTSLLLYQQLIRGGKPKEKGGQKENTAGESYLPGDECSWVSNYLGDAQLSRISATFLYDTRTKSKEKAFPQFIAYADCCRPLAIALNLF